MCAHWLGVVVCVTQLAADKTPEIEARVWFNSPAYRLHDDRDVVLFFFETRDRESMRLVRELNRLHRRPDTVVIGLTRDSKKRAQAFVRRERVRFTVGAESDSARAFRVGALPALVRVPGKARARYERIELGDLGQLVPDWGPYGEEDVASIRTPWELKAFIESEAYGRNRRSAIWKLYDSVGSGEFADFARGQLAEEGDPWVRNTLEFLLNQPGDDDIRAQTLAPSVEYRRLFESDPHAPEWDAVREYLHGPAKDRTAAQLMEDYWQHLSDQPDDTLIRRWIAMKLDPGSTNRMLRDSLLESIRVEPDFAVRLYLCGKLLEACEVGDTEAAALLEAAARKEPNVIFVKPMMEYSAYYLRTGHEDTRKMPPTDPVGQNDEPGE